MDLERALSRLLRLHRNHPTLFWPKWEAMIAAHNISEEQAQKMLMDIAAKSMSNEKPPEPKQSPEDMVKNKKKGK